MQVDQARVEVTAQEYIQEIQAKGKEDRRNRWRLSKRWKVQLRRSLLETGSASRLVADVCASGWLITTHLTSVCDTGGI